MKLSHSFLKPTILLMSAFCLHNATLAQTWSSVKGNDAYYWGEGKGPTIDEADREALSMLTSQISVSVRVTTEQSNKRKENNGNLLSDNTTFQSAINTYSQATLDSTNMVIINPAPDAVVGRWIKKSEVNKIFHARREKIYELVEAATRAKEKGKIDVALRDLYWAFTLLKTLPRYNGVKYQGHVLITWLPERIDDILCDLQVAITEQQEHDLQLLFTYKGKPVTSLDFTYSDSGYWSNLCSAKNGVGLVELDPQSPTDEVKLSIEFEYRNQAQLDPEVHSVYNIIHPMKLSKAIKTARKGTMVTSNKLQSDEASKKNDTRPIIKDASDSFTDVAPEFYARPEERTTGTEKMDKIMQEVLKSIRSRSISSVKGLFTTDAYSALHKLVRYGNAKIIGEPEFKYMDNGSETSVRGLTLAFSFHNGVRKNFIEDLVFNIDKNGQINNIAFGLGRTTEDDILAQSAYPEKIRKILVDFLQNYQTAFALGRVDYLERIFDDDALIIVGHVVKKAGANLTGDNYYLRTHPVIQYNRYSKDTYLTRLKTIFASQEYVNLRFNNSQVRKAANGGEIYGIQLEQDYYSATYSDHGYLFLEINLNNPDEPLIMVRTWQPEPDKDFGIYDIDNFPIQKFENLK